MGQAPKLRTVSKYKPPYRLNRFPSSFAYNLGREIVYFLASRGDCRLEGSDWEAIFARIVGASWKPSNVGLDDVVLKGCAWAAKTVKASNAAQVKKIRLISGRNSPSYSYGVNDVKRLSPNELGKQVLEIWNGRVYSIRKDYEHLRTVVLVKSKSLLELAVFEIPTEAFPSEKYIWSWNERGNLCGLDENGIHKFTWQPHGSQFTIVEDVPKDRLAVRIRQPRPLDQETVLKAMKFDKTWVEILGNLNSIPGEVA